MQNRLKFIRIKSLVLFIMLLWYVFPGQAQVSPTISTQPTSQSNLIGSNVAFTVAVDGTGPFIYQWQFNSNNLPNNIITTVAGNGNFGYSGDGNAATNACLYFPSRVAFDAAGNLYIADTDNNRIRKIGANGVITTVAGVGPSLPNLGWYSGDGGPATNANLYYPTDVAFDSIGNLYVADSGNFRVRMINTQGIITTVAGNGNYGYSGDGGPATNASLFSPITVAIDVSGNLFIADIYNNRIRKVDTHGIITTVVGIGPSWPLGGRYSGDGGAATNASLNQPQGVVSESSGNLFFADSGNNRIRKLDTNGIITTVAGNGGIYYSGDGGAATNANLYVPTDVAFDAVGNLFIADTYNNRIREVDANGNIATVAGNGYGADGSDSGAFSGDGSAATNASLWFPSGIAFDANHNLYFSDSNNHRIREVHFTGIPALSLTNISTSNSGDYKVVITGRYGSVTSAVATLTVLLPPSILVQPIIQGNSNATTSVTATGTLPLSYLWYFNFTNLVQSSTNDSLAVSNVSAANVGQYLVVVTNAYGSVTSQVATLSYPSSVTTEPASQIVLSGSNVTLTVTASGFEPLSYQWQLNGTNLPNNVITTVAGGGSSNPGDGGPATNAELNIVFGVTSDNQGNFYIADYGFCRIQKVNTNGIITTVVGNGRYAYSGDGGEATNASLYAPDSVAVGASGNLFIAEYIDSRIRKVDTNGIITTLAGNGTVGYSGDGGAATNASLNYPNGVAADSFGNVFIADTGNNCIRMVGTNGIITTVAGGGAGGLGDGSAATNASLNQPSGVALDAFGNLFIADTGDSRIREVSTNGIIATVAGNGTWGNSGDGGVATNASLGSPFAVAFDAFGCIFIADRGNMCVRQVDPNSIITTVAGNDTWGDSGDGGAATNASLNYPSGVALAASGGLLIADEWNFRVREITLGRSSALELSAVNTNNAGDYAVIITNPYGNGSVTSSVVSLTVVDFQFSNQVVLLGSNVTFSARAAGPVPVTYQWRFNDSNLDWATNASLTLTNLQLTDQGGFDVVVGNSYGSITSPMASLIVTGFPPSMVTVQPTNQTMGVGSNCTFTVAANGTPPLSYQWLFNGTNISWATNTTLTLTNVQLINEGSYDAMVGNFFGSATSSIAKLIVVDLSTGLNTPGLTWTTSGNAEWFAETTVTHDGVEAAQSGSVGNGQQSILQTTVGGPGILSFWWNISSFGSLSFSVNGTGQGTISHNTGWRRQTYYLGSGTQTLVWTYSGGTIPFGANAAWLDQVSYTSGGTAPLLTIAPRSQTTFTGAMVTFNSAAVGTPPLIYQWESNGANSSSTTNAILNLMNVQPTNSGIYTLTITNLYGSLVTNVTLLVQPFAINTTGTNLQLTANGLLMRVDGAFAPNALVIYASTNLTSWLPILTNPPATGSVQFLDPSATNLPVRFYRAGEQ